MLKDIKYLFCVNKLEIKISVNINMSFFFGNSSSKNFNSKTREDMLLLSFYSNNTDLLLLSSLSKKVNKIPPTQNIILIPDSAKNDFLDTTTTSSKNILFDEIILPPIENKKEVPIENKKEVPIENNGEISILSYFKKKINTLYSNLTVEKYTNEEIITNCLSENKIIKTANLRPTHKINGKYFMNSNQDSINKFILIVDFPNLGGGCTFFINSIISRYKGLSNFVIARSYHDKVIFNINEMYEIGTEYDVEGSIKFLKTKKNKISKIFINHTLDHNNDFINNLFFLQKEVTIITHDYGYIMKKYNPSYKSIIKEKFKLNDNLHIDLCDKIITQNETNIKLISPFLNNKKKIIVAELPDFNKSGYKVINNNNLITIGVIGLISDIKGDKIVMNVVNYYKKNNNVKVVIFGKINNESFKNQFIYNSIDELNELLILHKPNVLLEASVWPETYSYTLSLAMLTKLPILYLKKPLESVVEDRLKRYDKAYPFNSIAEFNTLLFEKKQLFFFTIEPFIYFNSFWDKYFMDNAVEKNNNSSLNPINIQNKNIVLITSKIFVSEKIFSYSGKRSIYTPQERLNQTIETIKSVRQNIPNTYIILFDNSNFKNRDEYFKILNNEVDSFLNITNNDYLNYYTDDYKYKGIAELTQLLEIYNMLFKNIDFANIENLFKISGRYLINDKFNYNKYNNDKNIIKKSVNIVDRNYWYTCFYKINKNYIHKYFEKINFILENKKMYEEEDLEVIFSKVFADEFSFEDELGITQNIAVWNEINDI